jgi:hypothetical protein
MADLNKFKRSKDRITEILNYLLNKTADDEKTDLYINDLQRSLQIIDHKMEEFERKDIVNN